MTVEQAAVFSVLFMAGLFGLLKIFLYLRKRKTNAN
jgi:uncharacterized membrane protein